MERVKGGGNLEQLRLSLLNLQANNASLKNTDSCVQFWQGLEMEVVCECDCHKKLGDEALSIKNNRFY